MVLETTISGSTENATLLAKGTTAGVYAWGEGRVLKLLTERNANYQMAEPVKE